MKDMNRVCYSAWLEYIFVVFVTDTKACTKCDLFKFVNISSVAVNNNILMPTCLLMEGNTLTVSS